MAMNPTSRRINGRRSVPMLLVPVDLPVKVVQLLAALWVELAGVGDSPQKVSGKIRVPAVVLRRRTAPDAVGEHGLERIVIAAGHVGTGVHHDSRHGLPLVAADDLPLAFIEIEPLGTDNLVDQRQENPQTLQESLITRKSEVVGIARVIGPKGSSQSR